MPAPLFNCVDERDSDEKRLVEMKKPSADLQIGEKLGLAGFLFFIFGPGLLGFSDRRRSRRFNSLVNLRVWYSQHKLS